MNFSAGCQEPETRLILMFNLARSERKEATIWGVMSKCPDDEESRLVLLWYVVFMLVLFASFCVIGDGLEV